MESMNRVSENAYKYVKEVLDGGFSSKTGATMMRRLEEAFASKFHVPYAISQINGTATLHTALEAFGVKAGDEVIVPPLTMSSTTFAVLQCNATPVFADVDYDTFVIDPKSIEERITDKTKAIITVSLYGLTPEMDAIMEIAKKYDLYVLEDNAECFLGSHRGKAVGTWGHVASYSFQSSKHLTSGEGGMLITEDEHMALAMRRVSSLGYAGLGAGKAKITKRDIQNPGYSRHLTMGWNYRMPELCAAVALEQVERIDELVSQRIQVAKCYDEVIENCEWLVPQKVYAHNESTYWAYVLRIDREDISFEDFRDYYVDHGGDGIYAAWKLTYLEPMFEQMQLLNRENFIPKERQDEYKIGLCPVAEKLQPRLLQFKTNYWDKERLQEQLSILKETIEHFNQ